MSYKYISDDNNNIRLISTLGYDVNNYKTFSPEEISAQVLLKMKQTYNVRYCIKDNGRNSQIKPWRIMKSHFIVQKGFLIRLWLKDLLTLTNG